MVGCRVTLTSMTLGWLFAMTANAAEPVNYLRDVKPIFKERCFACHGALKQESNLRLDTAELIRKGGDSGPAVTPGTVKGSLLIERITAEDDFLRMPPEGDPLTPEEIDRIRRWISQGAAGPENEQPVSDPREHWAFQPPERPELPKISSRASVQNPIDAFVAARHEERGLTPRPAAERHVLLRRVYLDLIGLPPTRDELHAFLADDSPQAYETVVNRLLDDPHYGERWARHWMDVWRYSDWYGRRHVPDVWNSAPQVWRWRDWIVRSLNRDKGYDRMVQEMLAADEICPDDAQATLATAYLIRNWYALNPNDWMRSTVEHTGKAFLGLTFNCAHCHDHKYDPIAQVDYFRLWAFFEPIGIRQDRVPGEADPGPFQEYEYGKLRKIQRLGAVRIFDKNPEAPTWFYTGGDERNRVTERGSIPPGLPAIFDDDLPPIEPVKLPPRAWYPGLHPEIQATLRNDCQTAIASSEKDLAAARQSATETSAALQEQLQQAEAAFETASEDAKKSGRPGALAGRQSLLLDASFGRRIVQNGLQQLTRLEDGSTLRFQLLILKDAHFNFQFARDIVKGLTAGYVGFDQGRILAYQPGSFTVFEAGRYDFAAGQRRFLVALVLQTAKDRCLLTVRSMTDDKVLVDGVPVALNGWNPVGDPTQAITFDARTGSVAAVDNVILASPASAATAGETSPNGAATFDFEPPTYADGRDVVGLDGWIASASSAAPATSTVTSTVGNSSLQDVAQKLRRARSAAEAPRLRVQAAEAKLVAAQADLECLEARILAERAKYEGTPDADAAALAQKASRLEREASRKRAEADVLIKEHSLAAAEAKPLDDAKRAAEVTTAAQQLAQARKTLEAACAASTNASNDGKYSPLSPQYPQTSTGRRRALALWITGRSNPLTARVAVNHIWMRHFHAPFVETVYDFGRNGADPTHPKLLDWLAVEFMESGWSMKHLHRLIVTSAAYRRSSSVGAASDNVAADPENKLLWRMNVGRMEAEVIRDSLLYCAGRLDFTIGGQELENSQALTTNRRSLYYSCHPEVDGKSEFGVLFDAPDALECYRRTRSIVPQQALALTNSNLVHDLSGKLAGLIAWRPATPPASAGNADETTGAAADDFLLAAFERILSRPPTPRERNVCAEFLADQTELIRKSHPTEAGRRARESLVRALLNHNDFITIR